MVLGAHWTSLFLGHGKSLCSLAQGDFLSQQEDGLLLVESATLVNVSKALPPDFGASSLLLEGQ